MEDIRSVAVLSQPILKSLDLVIEARSTFCNIDSFDKNFHDHMTRDIYTQRTAHLQSVDLVLMPDGAKLLGKGQFLLMYKDRYVHEQFPPYIDLADKEKLRAMVFPEQLVSEECLLVGRFGLTTWGHWLGEIFPKIVLVEARYPGRFSYVLPREVLHAPATSPMGRIRECVEAFEIPLHRLFLVDADKNYVFSKLHAVTPIWSDYLMHPGASLAVRQAFSGIEPGNNLSIAIPRDINSGRQIANSQEVYRVMQGYGYAICETGALPFIKQVEAFKGASKIFGVLGSDLTNMIFSPEGIRLLACAPSSFGDRFFYALVVDRKGYMADLRGEIIADHVVSHKGSFQVDVEGLHSAHKSLLSCG